MAKILPDFGVWLECLESRSRAVSERSPLVSHVYGDDPRQWLEVGEISNSGLVVPVFVHGGYWRALRAEDHRCVLPGLTAFGPTVANVEYRLMPGVRMADVVSDVRTAIVHLLTLLPERTKVCLVGHSAGAQLALAAIQSRDVADYCAAVVAVSGAFDLNLVSMSFLQDELALTEAEISAWTIHDIAHRVPTALIVGEKETAVFHDLSRKLAQRDHASMVVVRGAHHMSVLANLFNKHTPLVAALSAWLGGASLPDSVDGVSE
ncbi:alpha/beta hydrolase [Ammoniphilus sp. YIM 78166]|uniref:alpha/beta hydrolase n=1 Tax=Ammoniphilus sp. YIM 78166 TaxID=1644106 RepID=UPI001F0EDF03|nr:alpha/beta hydrolase [Ammoniphilus sp. YIM 78166]